MRGAPLPVLLLVILAACSDGQGSGATSSGSSGGGASSSSKSTVSSSSSGSTGTGSGGDAEWTLVPWHAGQCQFEYAKKPEHAFPKLEWTSCAANEAGCERLVKNWPYDIPTGLARPSIRRVGSDHALAILVSYPAFEKRSIILDLGGLPAAAYRTVPGTPCIDVGPALSNAGHWVGVQELALPEPASYVFQPSGEAAEAAQSLPITRLTNSQRGNDNLFTALLDFSKGIELYDRTTGQLHSTPTSFLSVDRPRLIDDAALFLAYPGYNQPKAWIWTRTGGYQKLIDPGPNVVVDVNADGQTLAWIQAPPKPEPGDWLPGTLYTAPYTTVTSEVVGTPRATLGSIPPGGLSAMGMGYYAFGAAEGVIQIIRVSDAQSWTYTVPVDEWRARLDDISYIDDTYIFFKTETNIYRQRLDALGPGEPAKLN